MLLTNLAVKILALNQRILIIVILLRSPDRYLLEYRDDVEIGFHYHDINPIYNTETGDPKAADLDLQHSPSSVLAMFIKHIA